MNQKLKKLVGFISIMTLAFSVNVQAANVKQDNSGFEKDLTSEGQNKNISYDKKQNSDDSLQINQTDFSTKDNLQSLDGRIETNSHIKNISVSCKKVDSDETYINKDANVSGDEWSIDKLDLKPGENEVTVTANTFDNVVDTKKITINYDEGKEYTPNNQNLVVDKSGEKYFNNVLCINFKNDVSQDKVADIVSDLNGEIKGYSNILNEYDIEIQPTSLGELKDKVNYLNSLPEVDCSTYEFVVKSKDNAYNYWNKNDPQDSKWAYEAISEGGNLEDVSMASGNIPIAVIDQGISTQHEDLNVSQLNGNYSYLQDNSHGTAVAGIIGAKQDNGVGITGLTPNVSIMFESVYDNGANYETITDVSRCLRHAVENGAKIINMSMGYNNASDSTINNSAKFTASVMKDLLSKGKDFLAVQSAGNESTDASKNGNFTSITDNVLNDIKCTSSEKENILNRIMVVGAAKNTSSGYAATSYSNYGDKVDIVAPADNVMTCVSNDFPKYHEGDWGYVKPYNNKFYDSLCDHAYASINGTSTAAPFVAGVAGIVWQCNPQLKGSEVKSALCNNYYRTINLNGSYKPLLNMPKAVNYVCDRVKKAIFDPTYYAYKYEDLRKAFGTDSDKLYNHYITCGIKEGRCPSAIFDPSYYLEKNPDVRNAYGNSSEKAYNHFIECGYNEYRESSPVFNMSDYVQNNPSLKNLNSIELLEHFENEGMNQGLIASSNFNVYNYRNRYADLRNAFGNDLKMYYIHFACYGYYEGRNGK